MNGYSEYNFDVTSAFAKDVNHLPALRAAIVTAFPNATEWESREPVIKTIDLRSSSAFTVALNDETVVNSATVGSEYVVQFTGPVTKVVFSANTTLTFAWCSWCTNTLHHVLVTVSGAQGSTITVTDCYGNAVIPDENGKYELVRGPYVISATASGYKDFTETVQYIGGPEIHISQTPVG